MKLIEMSLKLVMNETGFDLPKDVTNELMNLFNNIKMNGLDESMFNKNSSLISRYNTLLDNFYSPQMFEANLKPTLFFFVLSFFLCSFFLSLDVS